MTQWMKCWCSLLTTFSVLVRRKSSLSFWDLFLLICMLPTLCPLTIGAIIERTCPDCQPTKRTEHACQKISPSKRLEFYFLGYSSKPLSVTCRSKPSRRMAANGCFHDPRCLGWECTSWAPLLRHWAPCQQQSLLDAAFCFYSWKLPAYSGAFYWQLTTLAFLLTVGASLLTVFAFLFTVGAFLLTVGKCV